MNRPRPDAGTLHFDFTGTDGRPASRCFANALEIVSAVRIAEVLPALLRVQQAVENGLYAAGYVTYEAAPAFDRAMSVPEQSCLPLVWFGLYRAPLLSTAGPEQEAAYAVGEWMWPVDEDRFRAEIEAIRESIASGDFYQVNYTLRLHASFRGDAFAWYRRLRTAQRAAFSAYLEFGSIQILCLSPELFFRIEPAVPGAVAGRTIVTRPMKGTHPRGRSSGEDREFQERLRASEKDRAENLMIVDLLRNDLGRIGEMGSVRVEELFHVERYPTLLQMTSTVSAGLRPDAGLPEIMTSLFPCGSVTGAPKIAAMHRITALEPEPRQVYCGTIGYIEPGGRATFNVAIRTVLIDRETGVAEYGVGSGITWDSRAASEYSENRLKSEFLNAPAPPPGLFETLRLRAGVYTSRGRHVDRMLASADYFDIPAEREMLWAALDRQARERPDGLWRVRLMLSAGGEVTTECEPLDDPPDRPRTFALSAEQVDRENRMLFHKVTDRAVYASRKAERPDAYDVLMQNREGELTEFTTGNLVLEIDAARVTPPLDCGILPGVFRAELLAAGALRERVLFPSDLQRAARVWLINSLRGWVPMSWLMRTQVDVGSSPELTPVAPVD